jgi:hypothetical protein
VAPSSRSHRFELLKADGISRWLNVRELAVATVVMTPSAVVVVVVPSGEEIVTVPLAAVCIVVPSEAI